MKKLFNFAHHYFKLDKSYFTTIRGLNYAQKHDLRIGDIGDIYLKNQFFKKAIIKNWEDKIIQDIPLKDLKEDAEYEGFTIKNHQDFVDLINSFDRFKKTNIQTRKRIFYLEGWTE